MKSIRFTALITLAFTALVLFAHYGPEAWWMLFSESHRTPFINYSCISDDFVVSRVGENGLIYESTKGEELDRAQAEALLPLFNASQLVQEGRMPTEIKGVNIDLSRLRHERSFLRLKPEEIDSSIVNLRPLFDNGTGRVELEEPEDFLRLGKSAEFVKAKGNSLDKGKSALFTEALNKTGFVFPARLVASNPSTRKAYDEGVYALDSEGKLFRIRLFAEEARIERVADSMSDADRDAFAAINVAFMSVQEQSNGRIRLLFLDEKGGVWLLVGKEYHPVRLPLGSYKPSEDDLMIRGDMLNYMATASGEGFVECIAFDRDFNLLDRYEEALPKDRDGLAATLADVIFPFALEFDSGNSSYLGFHVQKGSILSLPFYLVLALIVWGIRRARAVAK